LTKTFLLAVAIFCSFALRAQYYYNDIIGTGETNRQMQIYIGNKVKMVSATGYTPQGSKATDFAEVQEITDNGKILKISRNSNLTHSSFYQRFDAQHRLISIIDTSFGIQNTTTYEYDAEGRIILAQNSVSDEATAINMVELHRWYYNRNGKVDKMWRTINGTDSLEIRFIPDENGNPGEEHTFRNGIETDMLYYYFDEQNRITDIVRYNKKVRKLIPDEIFSYDESGRVIQRITGSPADNLRKTTWIGYLIWRYIYNAQGLKTKEALFDNEQQLTGKIEYSYTFEK
jgi:YD repeat-containing protein